MEEIENQEVAEESNDNDIPIGEESKPAPEKRSYEIKVNNEMKKLELTDDELKVYLQKGLAGDENLRKAAQLRKEAEKDKQEALSAREELNAFYKSVKENPREALKKHPILKEINWLELSEQELLEHLQESAKDPLERELEELRRYKASIEEERQKTEAEKKAEEDAKQSEMKQKVILNTLSKRITETLQGEGGNLPNDPRTVARMAYYMMGAIQNGGSLAPEAIAKHVKSDYQSDFTHFTKDATPEQILEIIGEETFKNLQRWHLEKMQGIKQTGKPQQTQAQQAPTKQRAQKSKYKNIEKEREKEFGSMYIFPDDY
jgi:hypothetical protein